MNVSLTPELDRFVLAKVETGRYSSASEVVREALRLLQERDEMRELQLDEARFKIERGIFALAEGDFVESTSGELLYAAKQRARKRLEVRQKLGHASYGLSLPWIVLILASFKSLRSTHIESPRRFTLEDIKPQHVL